jgi:hypothetical protein
MGERRENLSCAVTILNAGRVNYDQQQQPEGINQDMSFAASSFLTSIKAAFGSAAVSRFDRLRVDDRSARLPLTPFLLTHIAAQTIMDVLPGLI